jgi:hypothetical protein
MSKVPTSVIAGFVEGEERQSVGKFKIDYDAPYRALLQISTDFRLLNDSTRHSSPHLLCATIDFFQQSHFPAEPKPTRKERVHRKRCFSAPSYAVNAATSV